MTQIKKRYEFAAILLFFKMENKVVHIETRMNISYSKLSEVLTNLRPIIRGTYHIADNDFHLFHVNRDVYNNKYALIETVKL